MLLKTSAKGNRRNTTPSFTYMSRHQRTAVTLLNTARQHFCGIGTRRTKLSLNKLSRTSMFARALRVALEIEDQNLTAKKYHGGDIAGYTYDQIAYFKKHDGIMRLVEICTLEGWTFGIVESLTFDATHLIYFDLPGVEQISWHFSPPSDHGLPEYDGVWDQKQKSTLRKLENAIQTLLKAARVNDKAEPVAQGVRQPVRLTHLISVVS
jgi:hypothetical protein